MAEIKSLVCDICGGSDAVGYIIGKRQGAAWIIDLCDTCDEPIRAMQVKGRAPAGKKRPYRRYGQKVEVVTDAPKRGIEAP